MQNQNFSAIDGFLPSVLFFILPHQYNVVKFFNVVKIDDQILTSQIKFFKFQWNLDVGGFDVFMPSISNNHFFYPNLQFKLVQRSLHTELVETHLIGGKLKGVV